MFKIETCDHIKPISRHVAVHSILVAAWIFL